MKQCRPFDHRFLPFANTEDQENIYRVYGECGSVVNEAARKLEKDPSRVSQVVRQIQERAETQYGKMEWDEDIEEIQFQPLKVWIFDIETAPAEAYVWNFYNTNIGHNQVKKYGHIMSFAGKWLGTDEVHYEENRTKNDKKITKSLINFFDQADIVIGHNGRAFDCKTVTGRALSHSLTPPSPYKIVDTFLSAKKHFKMARNSLEFLADELGCTGKMKHKNYPGFELWKACLEGDELAWEEMRKYNIQDVDVLEEVYLKMRPWITDHPNMGVLKEEGRPICPKCGSGELQKPRRKHYCTTNTGKYDLFVCRNCGGYCRGRTTVYDKEKRKALTVNAV